MIIVLVPAICVAISAIFFYWNFSPVGKSSWWKIAIAFLALLIAFIPLILWTIFDDLGLLALFGAVFASVIALISGLALFISFQRTRKTIGILIGLVIPVAMFASILIANDFSPTSILRKNGIILAGAIDQYKKEVGHYPLTLQELTPKYVTDLKGPNDYWGWLYLSTDQDFTIGYVDWVDKFGASVCLIRSTNRKWDCLMNSTGPFIVGPTPSPLAP